MVKKIMKLLLVFLFFVATGMAGHARAAGGDVLWHVTDNRPGKQEARAMASDAQGNVFVTGYQNNGNDDFYTVKFKADGSGVAWRASLDGSGGPDQSVAVVVDANGDVIVTGISWNGQNSDIRTAKYDGSTGELVWQKVFNGAVNGNDIATSIAVDSLNNVYVAGYSQNGSGNDDYITLKYAPTDGGLLWQVSYAGPANGNDQANSITAGTDGIAVTGQSWSGGAFDYLTVKYDFSGAKLWESRYSATGGAKAKSVKMDGSGNVIVTGVLNLSGTTRLYTAKYAAANGTLLWSRGFDGTYGDDVNGLALDGAGDVYVTGYTKTLVGNEDAYTARYAGNDGTVVWQKTYDSGSGNSEVATGIVIDEAGDVFVTGFTVGTNYDVLTMKYRGSNGNELWHNTFDCGSGKNDRPVGIVLSPTGQPLVGGWTDLGGSDLDFHVMKYDQGVLNQPTELSGTTVSATSIKLDWSINSTTEDGFKIERKFGETGTYAQIGTVGPGISTYTDTGLTPDNTYYYRVRAYNASNGDSLYSNEIHAITVFLSYAAPSWSYVYNNPDGLDDMAMDITAGSDNNPVVTGHSNRTTGAFDYYTAKLNRTDKSILWSATYADDDNGMDVAVCLALDSTDRVIVSGYAQLNYAPAGGNINSLFTLRYPAAGPPATWSAQYNEPGKMDDRPVAIATDAAGNFVVAGSAMTGGQNDIIVVEYNVDGSKAWSAAPFDGGGEDMPTAVAIAADGSVFVTGYSEKPGFPGLNNIFTAKYNGSSGALIWSDLFSVTPGGDNVGNSLAIDPAGDVYVTGYADNGAGNSDMYTIKYNGTGNTAQRVWERSLDGVAHGDDVGVGIKIDPIDGAVVVAGTTITSAGDGDITVARYSPAGDLVWKKTVLRNGVDDDAISLALDQSGYIYVAGNTGSGTGTDVISVILDSDGNILQALTYNGAANRADEAVAVTANGMGEAFIAGYTSRGDDTTDLLVLKQTNNYIQTPTSLTATPQTDYTKVNLAWTNVSAGTSLRIERTLGPVSADSTWSLINTSGAGTTSFQDSGLNGNTNYCYRIEAFNGTLVSRKRTVCATTFLAPPVLTQVTAVSSTALDVTWSNVAGNTGYKVERKTGVGGTYAQVGGTLAADTTVLHDSGLTAATTYFYRISAINGAGTSLPSSELSGLTLAAAPMLNTPGGITSAKIDLTWSTVTGNTGYKLERSTDNATWSQIATPAQNAASYSDTSVLSGTLYYYRLRTVNASGDSAPSASVSARTKLVSPTMSTVVAASNFQLNVTWIDPNGSGNVNETGFKIEYSACTNDDPAQCTNVASGNWVSTWSSTTAPVDSTSTTISGLVAGRMYRVRVTATLTGSDSDPSTAITGATTAFTQPVLAAATVLSTSAIDVAWGNVGGNDGYKVERKTGAGGTYAQVGGNQPVDTVLFHDTSLAAGTTYYYRVSILNSVGTSNEQSAITLPSAPTLNAPSSITTSQMTISWGNVTGNSGYKLERSTDNLNWTQIATPATNIASYGDSGLLSGTTYYYRVRATNASGDSGYSNILSARTKLQSPVMSAANPASPTQMDLTWIDPNGSGNGNETGFTIEFAACTNSTPAQCSDPVNGAYWSGTWSSTTAAADATSKSIIGLTGGRTYRFRITANLTGSDSAASTAIAGTTTSFTQPVLNTPVIVSTSAIDLAWNNVSGNTGYKVERKTGSGGTYAQAGTNIATDTAVFHDAGLAAGTTYYYRVSILNSVSGTSNEVSAITLPAAPTLNALSGVTATQINLSWANITGNAGYKVERSTDNSNWSTIATPATDAVSYSDTTVLSGTLYYYRIKATNASGDSAVSNVQSAKTKLKSPVLSSATSSSTTQIGLVWTDPNGTPSANETGITIEYSLCNNADPVSCSDVNGAYWGSWLSTTAAADSTSATVVSLLTGRSYRFRITATLTGANSDPSGMLMATTDLTAPVNLTASVASTTSITLTWTDGAGETNYKVEQDGSLLGVTLAKDSNTYTVGSLSLNTQYCFRVQPYNSTSSAFSNQACITIYGPPTLNSVTASAGPRVDVAWTDVTGETGYEVWQSAASSQSSPPASPTTGSWGAYAITAGSLLPANSTSYGVTTGLTAGYTYKYQVRYKLPDNTYSPYSNELMVTTIPPVPAGMSATTVSTSQITVNWTDGVGETGYNVQYKVRAGANCATEDWTGVLSNAASANTNSYPATGLAPGATYCLRMNASNLSGTSSWTTSATQTTLLAAPTLNAPSNIGQMNMDVSWGNVTGNTGYKIERSTTNTFASVTTFTVTSDVTSYSDTGLTPNQIYYYRVYTKNSAGAFSVASTSVNATTLAITSPTLSALSGVTFNKIDLSWGNVAGSNGYKIERSTANTFAVNLTTFTVGASVVSYSDTSVAGNQIYYYRVSTQNSGGFYSAPSSTQSATTPVITAPTLNALSGVTQVKIDLSWANITGNNGYKIERSTASNFGANLWSTTVVADVTSYSDTGLTPGQLYYYRVSTKNSGGFFSSPSSSLNATTLAVTAPIITFSGVTTSQVTLSWVDVPGNNGYIIERSANGTSGWVQRCDLATGVATCTDTGLTTATTYYYHGKSKNGSFGSAYSVSTLTGAPSAPSLTVVSDSRIDLTWAAVTGATGYKIMRSVGPGGPWIEVGNVAGTSTSDTGLTYNTEYCYQLKASTSGGDSASSGSVCQRTLAVPAPTITSVSALNSMKLKIDWALGSGSPDGYEIEVLLWNGEWARKGRVSGNILTFIDTKGIQPTKAYTYRVRANVGTDFSAYSNQVSATTPAYNSADGSCP